MPAIYEIFGHRLSDTSLEAQQHRNSAWCPFMGKPCDGGGNRYLSEINLTTKDHSDLAAKYPGRTTLHAGVCSLQPTAVSAPWIVCPRRLLALGKEAAGTRKYQKSLEDAILKLLKYPPGTEVGVWSEAKLQYSERVNDVDKQFDYTFDYVLVPLKTIKLRDALLTFPPNRTARKATYEAFLNSRGYSIINDGEDDWVTNFPAGYPTVIEIMTSSTSGGDKKIRSTIPQAFEDAILGKPHRSPTINKRQVWARMVSQLIVKSEIALGWGGITIWVVQDVLVDYINESTGLNMQQFISDELNEVNMLSFSYGDAAQKSDPAGVIELPQMALYSGPIGSRLSDDKSFGSFTDILRAPVQPPLNKLIELLVSKGAPINRIIVP